MLFGRHASSMGSEQGRMLREVSILHYGMTKSSTFSGWGRVPHCVGTGRGPPMNTLDRKTARYLGVYDDGITWNRWSGRTLLRNESLTLERLLLTKLLPETPGAQVVKSLVC